MSRAANQYPSGSFSEPKDEYVKGTQIKFDERRTLQSLLDYKVDSLLDIQEKLLIEHPVGERNGFWTVYEVCVVIKNSLNFRHDRLREIGL